jgi:hypothetical protein
MFTVFKMVWAAGQKLGDRYTIREVLGRGRWSVTDQAEDRQGQSVVIKAANDEAIASAEFDLCNWWQTYLILFGVSATGLGLGWFLRLVPAISNLNSG